MRIQLEELIRVIEDHLILYSNSFSPVGGSYPEENLEILGRQGVEIIRRIGALRPYLEHLCNSWIIGMHGQHWNILDAGVSMQSVGMIRGPSLRMLAENIHGILGRITLVRDDELIQIGKQTIELDSDDPIIGVCSRIGRAARDLRRRGRGRPRMALS